MSYENISDYAEKYLGPKESCQEFFIQAKQAGIHDKPPLCNDMFYYKGVLHVPIILFMACTIFLEKHCLPSSKTELLKQVVQMCVSRRTVKTMGKTASEVENLHELLGKSRSRDGKTELLFMEGTPIEIHQ